MTSSNGFFIRPRRVQIPTWPNLTPLAGRILLMNFASIHTSSFAITNAVFDIVSSNPAHSDARPGRVFVSRELKLVLAYVLMHYELKMPET